MHLHYYKSLCSCLIESRGNDDFHCSYSLLYVEQMDHSPKENSEATYKKQGGMPTE